MAEQNTQQVTNTQSPSVQAGGSSGIIGGLLNNTLGLGLSFAYSKVLQKRQHKYNQELSEYQFDRNLAQWNRQNEYNSPAAQRERLEAAGLNPALMYGNGAVSTGNANSMPQYQAFGQDLSNNMMAAAQIQQMAANTRLTNAQAENQEQKNPFTKAEAEAIIGNYLSTTRLNLQRVEESIQNVAKSKVEVNHINKVIEDLNSQINYREVQKDGQKIMNELNEMRKVTETLQQAAIRAVTDKDNATKAQIEAGTWYQEWKNGFIQKYGHEPDAKAVGLAAQIIEGTIGNAAQTFGNNIAGWYDTTFGKIDRKIDSFIERQRAKRGQRKNPSISRYNGR